ncbi:MAG TPA: response regulator transcription factor [Terriglobia bacterium]|nr:response regulator transcription factor [Terriglobia bacterium]
MKASGTILVIESDTALADNIARQIRALGYAVIHSRTIGEAAATIGIGTGDLLLLGSEIHQQDHFDILRRLRISSDIPIIVTSSNVDLDSKLQVLGLGIDDYIVKPFDIRELKVRMHNILRRARRATSAGRYVTLDGLKIDLESRIVIDRAGNEQLLTRAETDLLALLIRNEGSTLPREQLLDTKSPEEAPDSARRVDILISRLRRKLERDPSRPALLLTVRGIGYRLRRPVR